MNNLTINSDARFTVQHLIEQSGLKASLRIEQPDVWQTTWSKLPLQPVWCASSMIDYQHAYMNSSGQSVVDTSLILLNDGKPCGIWPLTLTLGGATKLSSMDAPIVPPVFVENLSPRTVKKIIASALCFLVNFNKKFGHAVVNSQCFIAPHGLANGLSEWHQQMMSMGADVHVKHDLYIDLMLSLDEIRAGFRKSYRPLISAGLKLWTTDVMDSSCPNREIWESFKLLHRHVAGRITRSDETWELQYQMIQRNEAFLIHTHDPQSENIMVGAGFFQFTRDEGLYSVAAYDRDLFDKPSGHVVQQRAIETMKRRGLSSYRIGERLYSSDTPKPSEKELSISLFKQGFATCILPRFMLSLTNLTEIQLV